MPKITLLVGPPGSGKSTLAKKMESEGFLRISQDDQGKNGHLDMFLQSLHGGRDIVIDRMNFNVQQRSNYLLMAKKAGYFTEIRVIHESYSTCFERAMKRIINEGHPTIKDEKNARSALQTFFTKYERPQLGEADLIVFQYPDGPKEKVIVCDLDGTLCDVEHRRHHVRRADGEKKDWVSFFKEIPNDPINEWCSDIIWNFAEQGIETVFCSGRSTNEQRQTVEWLKKHGFHTQALYMRDRHDSRPDYIIKEIILDFELLTRYQPYFMIDDRDSVVEMWRRRGYTCLQCAPGDF